MKQLYQNTDRLISWLIVMTLLVLGLALKTNNPVQYADSADLILSAGRVGLAHAPGYPLYVLLLSGFMKLFWFVPNNISAGWLSVGLMSVAGGLLGYLLIGLIRSLSLKKIVAYEYVTAAVLWWATIPLNWKLFQVVEIMPLALVLILLFGIQTLKLNGSNKDAIKGFFGLGLFGTLAGLYHPLLLGLVSWVWLVSWWEKRKSIKKIGRYLLGGIVLGGVITGLAYAILARGGNFYSWQIPQNLAQWWQYWSRQIYTADGSAIETFSGDWRIGYLIQALKLWFGWWWSVQFGAAWLLIGGLGGFYLIGKRRRQIFWYWVIPMVVYGPMLVMYLKHPASYMISETELWWGIALRERMFYVWSLLIVIPSTVGLIWLSKLVTNHKYLKWFLFVSVAISCVWRVNYQFQNETINNANAASLYSEQLLTTLPPQSVLIVDSDILFELLYSQQMLHIREDVVVIPVGMILLPKWWQANGGEYSQLGFSNKKQEYVADLVITSLKHNKKVFLYGIEAETLIYLGLEGNPFYGIPYGYTLEVRKIGGGDTSSYDYGLSVQLASIQTNKSDYWFKGFRTHLGGIHAQDAYYLARLGFEKEALWHAEIAKRLFYFDSSRNIVDQSFDIGNQRFTNLGSYLNYQPQQIDYDRFLMPNLMNL